MDYYLNPDNAYQRLEDEYLRYGKLIIACDFDDTLYNCHNIPSRTYDCVIKLLQRWENYSDIIIWTGNGCDAEYDIICYLMDNNIPFNGINCNSRVLSGSRKIYANVFLDDRGGLAETYNHLLKLIDKIESGETKYEKI